LTSSDLLRALGPVVDALEELGVPYYVGGSLASSAHGMARSSIDADVVTDLGPAHVAPQVRALERTYYASEERIDAAIQARRSFNLIPLETMFKVDVFVTKGRPFDRQAFARARRQTLEDVPEARGFLVASPEDTILAKLEWFRAGGESSQKQWADVIGVLRTGGDGLDRAYLRRWASAIGVEDLLERALRDAEPTA
jgi:hypothetical protein